MSIKCCVFDMGGVLVRNFHIAPRLLPFLGLGAKTFGEVDPALGEGLQLHSAGKISEEDFWLRYTQITGMVPPPHDEALFGKFFRPTVDEPTLEVLKALKGKGMRVVAGTNVIDAHFRIHNELNQYGIFDKVYASHLMGITKPAAAFFEYILNEEGVKAGETFFTDDMAENVNAAAGTGINAFLYTDAGALLVQLQSLGVLPRVLP